ncbi:D-alanyl-D-alanine carboxypeptidase family protein [Burkholderia sp. Ac-20379]|uniref:D-alanyl-D-alanine carboxypeptidase family protein n=1 Tax=Burkholderia sp. Ac-20379 TaxID=2703900 RepID=UPI0030DB64B5
MLALSAAACLSSAAHAGAAEPPAGVRAVSWLVLDGESGTTLAEHNADAERQPASLTKLMTACLVLDALKRGALRWDERIVVSEADVAGVGADEARMYLTPGQAVPVKTLVRGLIAASANDAAMVLARRVGGSPAAFEQRMNAAAQALGMTHTHFTTPSGITTPGNHSTARDLSILALHITRAFPEYYAFSSDAHFAYGRFSKRNKNWLLGKDPSVDGMKTGHTEAAGYCIVATAKRRQPHPAMMRRVFAVLLGAPSAPDRIAGAARLLDYGFSAFADVPGGSRGDRGAATRPAVAGKPA